MRLFLLVSLFSTVAACSQLPTTPTSGQRPQLGVLCENGRARAVLLETAVGGQYPIDLDELDEDCAKRELTAHKPLSV